MQVAVNAKDSPMRKSRAATTRKRGSVLAEQARDEWLRFRCEGTSVEQGGFGLGSGWRTQWEGCQTSDEVAMLLMLGFGQKGVKREWCCVCGKRRSTRPRNLTQTRHEPKT